MYYCSRLGAYLRPKWSLFANTVLESIIAADLECLHPKWSHYANPILRDISGRGYHFSMVGAYIYVQNGPTLLSNRRYYFNRFGASTKLSHLGKGWPAERHLALPSFFTSNRNMEKIDFFSSKPYLEF